MKNDIKNKKLVLFDIDYTLFDTASFIKSDLSEYKLYEEVKNVLKKIARISELGIFSEGTYDFQTAKLLETGIIDHFTKNRIHIFTDKKSSIDEVLDKYKKYKIFLVDDKINVLMVAKKTNPSTICIWLKNGPFAERAEGTDFNADFVLTDLKELEGIIENYG